jgi:hypothetical protein
MPIHMILVVQDWSMARIVLTKSLQKYKIALKMTYSTCSMIHVNTHSRHLHVPVYKITKFV